MTSALATTSPFLWYSSRALGTVSLVLLTAAVVMGILTSTRAGSATVPRFAVATYHRSISLVALVFLVLHILTAVTDTYVPVGWASFVVPFASHYKGLWIGLGTVAFDLLLAVAISSMLRHRIAARSWRAVHWLVYLSFPIGVAHAIGVGTDLKFGWMQLLTGACLSAVLAAVVWRIGAHPRRGGLATARPAPRSVYEDVSAATAAPGPSGRERQPATAGRGG